jgi:endonuclease III
VANGSTVCARPARRIRTIVARLETVYGPRPWKRGDDPLEELVGTILSQNTNDANSAAAYEELTRRFRTWQDVLAAPVQDVAAAIRSGGLADQKARTIQRALERIRQDFGRISLDDLALWDGSRSMEYLTSIPGIGPKTAACVLMFAFSLPVFPVDTHIHRQAIRLGLVPRRCTAVQAQEALQAACPPKLVYPFHVLLISHGRNVCRARQPDCPNCVLKEICPSALPCVTGRPRSKRKAAARCPGADSGGFFGQVRP